MQATVIPWERYQRDQRLPQDRSKTILSMLNWETYYQNELIQGTTPRKLYCCSSIVYCTKNISSSVVIIYYNIILHTYMESFAQQKWGYNT